MKTILGVDPGLSNTGWGVIEYYSDNGYEPKYNFVDCGVFKTNSHDGLGERLSFIYDSIFNLIKTVKPDEISMERVFVNINPASSEKLIMARTAAFLAIEKTGHKCVEFTPNEVKKKVTGAGHGSKELVKKTVQKILNLNPAKSHYSKNADANDALAIALCSVLGTPKKVIKFL